MKLTFRWYGEDDPVTLDHIRQIPGMSGIVSAVYDVEPGNVWSRESIAQIRDQAREKGLTFEVVESVPVPEEIKLGTERAPLLIAHYCENIRRLGEAGIRCIATILCRFLIGCAANYPARRRMERTRWLMMSRKSER